MSSNLRRLMVLVCVVLGGTIAARAAESQARIADGDATISFETLDGDIEEINPDEIWRIRAASTRDEPAGTTVIDYAFERLFVEDPLAKVVEKVRKQRDVKQFTLPSGSPVYIVPGKVVGIKRSLPFQHHQNSKSIIIAREGEQQVQESRETVRAALDK